jgi:hypothetical protein
MKLKNSIRQEYQEKKVIIIEHIYNNLDNNSSVNFEP